MNGHGRARRYNGFLKEALGLVKYGGCGVVELRADGEQAILDAVPGDGFKG